MRDSLCQTKFITDPKEYNRLLRTRAKVIHDSHIVSEHCIMVTMSDEEEYNEGNGTSNLAIAAFTTSHARLRLLKLLRQLNDRVLYFDTDSIIYIQRPGDWEPPTGSCLGDWDDQLEAGETHIVSFISLGPKCYRYVTNTGRVELKMKGITQNGHTEDILVYNEDRTMLVKSNRGIDEDTFPRLLADRNETVQVINPDFLKKDRKYQTMKSIPQPKTLRLTYDKRVLHDDYTTSPFGTR